MAGADASEAGDEPAAEASATEDTDTSPEGTEAEDGGAEQSGEAEAVATTEPVTPADPDELRAALDKVMTELEALQGESPLVPACVDADLVGQVISGWTGIPVGKMVRDDLAAILDMEIHVPSQFMGDITGDVNSRRGRIQGIDTDGDSQVIRAQVPESEVKVYSTQLRSLTGGEGSYSVEFSHYEIVPSNVQQRVISEIQKAAAESS